MTDKLVGQYVNVFMFPNGSPGVHGVCKVLEVSGLWMLVEHCDDGRMVWITSLSTPCIEPVD